MPSLAFLFGFGMGMILASFHIFGIVFRCMARLYVFVRYAMALGPRCLRCCIFMSSGPVDLFVLLFLIAVSMSASVKRKVSSFGSLCVFLSMIRSCLSVV